MKNLALITMLLLLGSCSHNPHKAERIDSEVKKSQAVQDEEVGIKSGNMVVQKKVSASTELKRLQFEVYELEDRVYGNRRYGSKGLFGALKECRSRLSSKELGGDGKVMWTEPEARVTSNEQELKLGLDEKDQLVGISEEHLKDRLARFKGYKQTLEKRQTEYEDKLEVCDAAIRAKSGATKAATEQND